MSTMHVTCFLYLMIVIKHGRLFFKNSSFFKKLQCGILSGPETGRSFRATFWFVFTKPRPTASGPMERTNARWGERTTDLLRRSKISISRFDQVFSSSEAAGVVYALLCTLSVRQQSAKHVPREGTIYSDQTALGV